MDVLKVVRLTPTPEGSLQVAGGAVVQLVAPYDENGLTVLLDAALLESAETRTEHGETVMRRFGSTEETKGFYLSAENPTVSMTMVDGERRQFRLLKHAHGDYEISVEELGPFEATDREEAAFAQMREVQALNAAQRYDESEVLLERIIADHQSGIVGPLMSRVLGTAHVDVALFKMRRKDWAGALPHVELAVSVLEKGAPLLITHQIIAAGLNHKAVILGALGRKDEAIETLTTSIDRYAGQSDPALTALREKALQIREQLQRS